MCLAVPAKLAERIGDQGIADLHSNRFQIPALLVRGACAADWALTHGGSFSIQRLSPKKALEAKYSPRLGQHTRIISEIAEIGNGLSEFDTPGGGRRLIQNSYGEQLSRMCEENLRKEGLG